MPTAAQRTILPMGLRLSDTHVSPVTTSKHYAKRMATVPAGMVQELALWVPGNVVSLRTEG
jgi:hypothetical protein